MVPLLSVCVIRVYKRGQKYKTSIWYDSEITQYKYRYCITFDITIYNYNMQELTNLTIYWKRQQLIIYVLTTSNAQEDHSKLSIIENDLTSTFC